MDKNEILVESRESKQSGDYWFERGIAFQKKYDEKRILDLEKKLKEIETAVELAAEDELFFINRNGKVYPSILVNDTFYYATSDCEDVDWSLMPELLEQYKKDKWVLVEWVCKKRNMRPLKEIEEVMKNDRSLRDDLNLMIEVGELVLRDCEETGDYSGSALLKMALALEKVNK